MIKILLTGNSDIVIYNFRLEFIEELLRQNYEVIVVAPYGPRIESLKKIGCKYIDIDIDRHGTNPIVEIKLIKEYRKIIELTKPDIVFSYTIKPNLYCAIACRLYNVPIVVTITGLGTAVEYFGWKQIITIMLYKYSFTKVNKIIFQNKDNMNFFIKHRISNRNKYELVPGSGVNLEKFYPMDYPKENQITFAFISRIMKEKGIDLYIKLAKNIKREYKNVRFIVCGFCEDDYEEKLRNLSKKGIIDYKGMLIDIKPIYQVINCLVFPSYYPEGLSNVLLEASACSRPIITTNRSGCKEVIVNEYNGYEIKEKDYNDLYFAVKKFILLSSKQKEKMGKNARERVEQLFDRRFIVNKNMEIICSIIKK